MELKAITLVGTDIADGVVGLDLVHRIRLLLLLLLQRLFNVDVGQAVRLQTGVLNISEEDVEDKV